jgi:PRTRC genetic system ThiF family protein
MKRTSPTLPVVKKRRNKDGLLYTPGKAIAIPPHTSAINLSKHEISVALIGCGGTGSQVLTGLGQMHASIQALHQQEGITCRGLNVDVYDPDTVSPFNVGRQLFYATDIGMNKAEVLVGRVNMAYGTKWKAVAGEYEDGNSLWPDVIITCVDTAKARRELHKKLWAHKYMHDVKYWLDCGNLATVGQVVLGQPGRETEDQWPRGREFDPSLALWKGQQKKPVRGDNGGYNQYVLEDKCYIRLPCVTELFPDLMDENFDETSEPSCSMIDALRKQSLFINRTVSAYAVDILWELIREGKVENQGVYFNLRTRTANPVPLKVWPVAGKRYYPTIR